MDNVSLLLDGSLVCELIHSALYPLPDVGRLMPGRELVIVTPLKLDARDADTLALPGRSGIPIRILSCRLGIEGWESAVRIAH